MNTINSCISFNCHLKSKTQLIFKPFVCYHNQVNTKIISLNLLYQNKKVTIMYKQLIKPLLFKMDPERVHDHALALGKVLGKIKIFNPLIALFYRYKNRKLTSRVNGIKYLNPVGLAAGFDKNADLMNILPSIGFGFEEVGSITALPYKGNPKPRLHRLPKYKSLVVNYGLKNIGAMKIEKKLKKRFKFPIGINIAKTNCKETIDTKKGIIDYYLSLKRLQKYADYVTINISCPNTFGGEPFTEPKKLDKLLAKLNTLKSNKPRYIKLSPDLSIKEVDSILKIVKKYNIQGFVISNLVKKRETTKIPMLAFSRVGKGGLSGKPVQDRSDNLISYIYKKTKGQYTIIGVGGIFNAKDAYEKIISGASLVQLITGMIYEGPMVIKKINKGLVRLLEKDDFTNISQAVGSKHKK